MVKQCTRIAQCYVKCGCVAALVDDGAYCFFLINVQIAFGKKTASESGGASSGQPFLPPIFVYCVPRVLFSETNLAFDTQVFFW